MRNEDAIEGLIVYLAGAYSRYLHLSPIFRVKMPSLRLGNTAPDFEALTTAGPIKFHDWIGDSWV